MITGRHTYLGSYEERFSPEVEIGNFCAIGSGLILYGSCQHPQTVSTFPFTDLHWCDESIYPKSFSRGRITIGNDVWIGEDVTIMDGVMIGDGAIIGTGSIVSKSILPYSIAVGNPIVVKKLRFTRQQIKKLLRLEWWNWQDEKIKEELPYFKDVDEFIRRNIK